MLDKKWIPDSLMQAGEKGTISIADGSYMVRFRRVRIVLRLIGMLVAFGALKLTGRLDYKLVARLLGDFCLESGVLWIKLGQLMSMRSDLFPMEFCMRLAQLQDRAVGFSPEAAMEIIREELGRPLETVFSQFQEQPCAAASIAQVHRAYLAKEKTWVAVKVRRPGVDRIFKQDMAMMRTMFMMMHRLSIMMFMRWPHMLRELEQVLTEELDYRYELSNQQRLRKTLEGHDVYVPKVFPSYSSKCILVMEYVEAVAMGDYLRLLETDPARVRAWETANGIEPEIVGKRLLQSYLRQILEDNLFHADLHPGNIFLLRDNRIVLLDFGSVGSNEGDFLRKYDVYLETLSSGQFAKAVDVFLMIMPDVPSASLTQVRDEIRRRLQAWDNRCRIKELPYTEKSSVTVSDEIMKVMARYGVTINWSFFKVLRGWTTMDTSLRSLVPAGNLPVISRDYYEARKKREFKHALKQLPADILKLQDLIDYPREFSEQAMYRGAAVRRLAQVFEGTATRLSRLVAGGFQIASLFCILITLTAGAGFLFQHTTFLNFSHGSSLNLVLDFIPFLDPQVWFLFGIFFLYGTISLAGLAFKFRKQE